MNLLLLPGNSVRNKPWIHDVNTRLSKHFDKSIVHHYKHWETDDAFIDFGTELKRVETEIADLYPYAIFAKSVGSILALRGTTEGAFNPHSLLIAGFPLRVIEEMHLPVAEWLRKINVPIMVIQNEDDPLGSFAEVSKYINQRMNSRALTVTSLPGNTHDYKDFDKLEELSAAFLGI